jgi:Tfp pilus assembly protein PilF
LPILQLYIRSIICQQGNYEKAQEYFKESLMHLEKHYGKNHFQTGRVLCNLGLVAWKTNDFVESERLLKSRCCLKKQDKNI